MRTLFVFFALLLSCAAGAATFSGTVTAAASGSALAGMTVAAYASSGTLQATSTTVANGTWTLTVPAGTYRLLAYDPSGVLATSFYDGADSYDSSATFAVTSAQVVNAIHFRLAAGGRITGRITTTASAPLPAISIEVYNLSGTRRGFTTTDASGSYALTVPPGEYRVVAFDNALQYAPQFFANASLLTTATKVSVAAAADTRADMQLQRAARFTGIASDRTSGAPLAGIGVTAYAADLSRAASAVTSGDGRYTLALAGGAYRVVFHSDSGDFATTYYPDAASFAASPALAAIAGETLTLNASLSRAAKIGGRIVDRATGLPVEGMTVGAYNLDGSLRAFAQTQRDGTYAIVVPAGDFRIGAHDPALRYLPLFYPAATFDSATRVSVQPLQSVGGVDLSVARGARLSGVVTDSFTNEPLAGMPVHAYNIFGQLLATTTSTATGAWAMLVEPGAYRLLAFDPALQYATGYYGGAAYFAAIPTINVLAGDSFRADLALPPAGRIIGSVYAALTNIPLTGMHVLAYDAEGTFIASTVTDERGAFRLALQPGSYRVAATDPAARFRTAFHANAPTFASATTLNLAARQELSGIRFALVTSVAPPRRRAVR